MGNTLVFVRRGAGPTTAGKISLSMHCNGPAPCAKVWGRKVWNRWCRLALAMSVSFLEMEILYSAVKTGTLLHPMDPYVENPMT